MTRRPGDGREKGRKTTQLRIALVFQGDAGLFEMDRKGEENEWQIKNVLRASNPLHFKLFFNYYFFSFLWRGGGEEGEGNLKILYIINM